MTTISQVKRWTRPLIDSDSGLALIGRNLVLSPVGHLIRGIFVDRTSSRDRTRLLIYVQPLFFTTREGPGFQWSQDQPTLLNEDEGFDTRFLGYCKAALQDVRRIASIADFAEETEKIAGRTFGHMPITSFPLRHAVVLAALGRFEDARRLLTPLLENEEARLKRVLASAQAELAVKPKNGVAKVHLANATTFLKPIGELKPLLSLLEANDQAGVASWLRGKEEQNAKQWDVSHLWEPTSFPFE
jgi:hypothetical protein